MKKPAADQQIASKSNVYRTLYDVRGFCSKQELAKKCGISMPTLYQNLNDLMEQGLVCYSGEERSTGGRKAQGLGTVSDARVSVGLSMTEKSVRMVAADLRLQELAYQTVPFDTCTKLRGDPSEIGEILERFLNEFDISRKKLLGVGITIPGIISPDHTRLLLAPTLGLENIPLNKLIHSIPYPTYIDNDGTSSGHAEGFVRRSFRNMAYLSLENGVGGAVLTEGRLYEGNSGRSGEFGHICVEPGGLRCSCGRNGCLEAYCSPLRIEKTFGVDLETFFQGVENHNPEYEALLSDILRHLAIGVNNMHTVLDSDVVLGGFFSEYLQPYLPLLRQYVMAGNPLSSDAGFLQLSAVPHHITALGAALYFIRDFIFSV
ncbi:MAG: ROK family transcriptional regulator [Oscillospiraceae bacterium]|nr:ROK family transcriptional regulator [Oscillospiraceae bacterium]